MKNDKDSIETGDRPYPPKTIPKLWVWVGLITSVIVISAGVIWWITPPPSDVINFTNGPTDLKAVLIDGTLGTEFKNDMKPTLASDIT